MLIRRMSPNKGSFVTLSRKFYDSRHVDYALLDVIFTSKNANRVDGLARIFSRGLLLLVEIRFSCQRNQAPKRQGQPDFINQISVRNKNSKLNISTEVSRKIWRLKRIRLITPQLGMKIGVYKVGRNTKPGVFRSSAFENWPNWGGIPKITKIC